MPIAQSPIRLLSFLAPVTILTVGACAEDNLGKAEADEAGYTEGRTESADDVETSEDAESSGSGSNSSSSSESGPGTTGGSGSGGPKFDILSTPDNGDGCGGGDNDATLTGTVFAPNGTIPVVNALVYTTNIEPEGIQDGVYCAECVELECGLDYTETDIDGSFTLPTDSGNNKYLVVQKGQFMRITQLDIDPGETELDDGDVELPGEWNPDAGLYIPRIAVADGTYDRIEDALGKFGLADTSISSFEESSIPGTESFDLYDNGRNPASDGFISQGTMGTLVNDPELMAQYHIIFVPCSSDTFSNSLTPQAIENIREWVAAGGRWYAADWSGEFFWKVFPEYQTFYGGQNTDLGSYDSLADVLDDGMLAWLEGMPDVHKDINPFNDEAHPTLFDLPQVQTVDNWSGIQYPLPELLVEDGEGNPVNVGLRAWLEGPGGGGIPQNDIHPLTVTGQYGCGKIQFTSYHTAEFFDYVGLSPQELVLLYTILEIGVCQEALPPPQG